MLSAPVNNNTRIDAEGGGLIVQTPANNNEWDGVGNTGSLNAISGNLELRDNAVFLFNGAFRPTTPAWCSPMDSNSNSSPLRR